MSLTPQKIARLKIKHEAEGMFFVPKSLNDYRKPVTNFSALANLPEKTKKYVVAKLHSLKYLDDAGKETKFKPTRVKVVLTDDSKNFMTLYIFGNVWPWKKVYPGDTVHLFGEVKMFNGYATLSNPEFVSQLNKGRLAPVYRHISGSASSETVQEAAENAKQYTKDAISILEASIGISTEEICKVTGFTTIPEFFQALHDPIDIPIWNKAIKGAQSLAKIEIMEKAKRVKARPHSMKSMVLVDEDLALSPKASDGSAITLTKDQVVAVKEIVNDLRSARPMQRLLSGDVGTGKTLTFAGPCAAANLMGSRVAILAPNEVLASQIAQEIRSSFPQVAVELVTKSNKPNIDNNPILVGTTALNNFAKKKNWKADFLVVDEQHKMSREQREAIATSHTNILESTATAIPRSLAILTHGGMDVSILRETPVKRNIETKVITQEDRAHIYDAITETIEQGKQVAIVYSEIDENEKSSTLSLTAAAEMWETFAPGRVVTVHGQMDNDEKVKRIEDMKAGVYDIMICSTVVEVGITVPNLKTMVVVDPDRYGLAQLHQLRGRLSRKGGDGLLILFPTKELKEKSMERLIVMTKIKDGFSLSEADMLSRGFGDLDLESDEQNGETKFCFRGLQLSVADLIESSAKKVESTDVAEPVKVNPPLRANSEPPKRMRF